MNLLGGSSFRAPSPNERRYNDGGFTQVAPPAGSLDAERIWTGELEVAHRIDAVVLSANAYYNRIENLVAFDSIIACRSDDARDTDIILLMTEGTPRDQTQYVRDIYAIDADGITGVCRRFSRRRQLTEWRNPTTLARTAMDADPTV